MRWLRRTGRGLPLVAVSVVVTDAEVIAEGAQYGTWLTATAPRKRPGSTSSIGRVAVVGGSKFDEGAVDAYLAALRRKYSEVTIVTGNGRGAETYVAGRAAELGLAVEVTPLEDWWPSNVLQVEATLTVADAIVVVGSEKAARAARAIAKHKLVDAWRTGARPLVKIAPATIAGNVESGPKAAPGRTVVAAG